jgi:hypothetical protein
MSPISSLESESIFEIPSLEKLDDTNKITDRKWIRK